MDEKDKDEAGAAETIDEVKQVKQASHLAPKWIEVTMLIATLND